MLKKIILVLAGIFLFFGGNLAQANVVINEVKLYPTEERFIELYNTDNKEVDLTNWYIQRKTLTGNSFGSLVSKTYLENKKINANGYFLISRNSMTNSDVVLSSLTLTESNTIQIKNSSGEVVGTICWGEINDCGTSIASNPVEGQSIQRDQNNLLILGNPTPGTQNYATSEIISDDTDSNTNDSDNSTNNSVVQTQNVTEIKPKITEIPKIKTKITAKTLAFRGIPIELKANTTVSSNEILLSGKYFWNFGDGDSREMKANDTTKLMHAFSYVGDYTIALEYYENYFSENPDASDKIFIKVIPTDISISKTGDEKDFFIEISNNTSYDADLSKWILVSETKSFILPKNTIIPLKKKIILSPKITNFSILDKNTLKLANPSGEIIFNYLYPITEPTKAIPKNTTPEISKKISTTSLTKSAEIIQNKVTPEKNSEKQMPALNLNANAIESDTEKAINFKYGMFGLFIFLALSGGTAYFIRSYHRKPKIKITGDDFEIIDE
ncbi:MAG: lamin tail domain-containing protein [Candidatus Paceibacterota bacterium]